MSAPEELSPEDQAMLARRDAAVFRGRDVARHGPEHSPGSLRACGSPLDHLRDGPSGSTDDGCALAPTPAAAPQDCRPGPTEEGVQSEPSGRRGQSPGPQVVDANPVAGSSTEVSTSRAPTTTVPVPRHAVPFADGLSSWRPTILALHVTPRDDGTAAVEMRIGSAEAVLELDAEGRRHLARLLAGPLENRGACQ